MAVELTEYAPKSLPAAYTIEDTPRASIVDINFEFRSDAYPPLPRGQLACAIALFISGLTLIILGFVSEVVDIDPSRGIAFWVLGSITFIPGFYFSFLFYKAYRARSPEERMRIMRDIPQF